MKQGTRNSTLFSCALTTLAQLAVPTQAMAEPIGIWTTPRELAALPMEGRAWEALSKAAAYNTSKPDLSNMNDETNVRVLAKALVYARTGHEPYRSDVIEACRNAIGTEGASTLAIARELAAYVIAADLVGLPAEDDQRFRSYLRSALTIVIKGRTLRSTPEDRPNNWGTHAGASRAAVAAYLADRAELDRTATVFRGWLGDRSAYAGFKYRDLDWQSDPSRPVGINPVGATRDGRSIDGVMPDDQRRGGSFRWPPPNENYTWESLQGALVTAIILHRAGYDVWNWEHRALLRAVRWLHEENDFPAVGDDTWQPHIVNHFYGTDFPAPVPSRTGKNAGFTDWTFGPGAGARLPLASVALGPTP